MAVDALQSLIDNLTRRGLAATFLANDESPCIVSDWASTGCYILDAIMGGGLPLGRIVEIYGNTSTGKSLIAAQACAFIQGEGGTAVYIDTETAVSLPIMEAVGVDIDNLVYLAPDTVEEVFKAMEITLDSKPGGDMIIVWDSIAATSAQAEMGKATGEVGYLTQARVISQGLRKLARVISKEQVAVLFLNQAKTNIGVVFGDKVATFGGKSVGFHASIRVMLSVASKIKGKNKRIIGINARAVVKKNKVAPPFREALLPIYFGYGVDDAEAAFLYLKDAGVVKSVGGGYYSAIKMFSDKFRRVEWADIFDNSPDTICNVIDAAVSGGDLI